MFNRFRIGVDVAPMMLSVQNKIIKKSARGFIQFALQEGPGGGDFILKQTTIDEKEATYSQTKVVSRYMKTESMSGAT